MKLSANWLQKAPDYLKKYRYPVLILLLGLGLLLLPTGKKRSASSAVSGAVTTAKTSAGAQSTASDYRARTEAELSRILSRIEGAGKVEVMLSLSCGPETVYQTDGERQTQSEGEKTSTTSRRETVLISRGNSYNEPVIVKEQYPVFQGALIVSEGGGNAAVRYQLSGAVSALLGIGTDKITVVKMK